MLKTIVMIGGWASLVFAVVIAVAIAIMVKGIKAENADLKAKAMPAMVIGWGGLFLSGATWLVCWLISLFV